MPAAHSAAIAQSHLYLQNQSRQLNIPLYHILILAWSALVILYGETGLSAFISLVKRKGFCAGCPALTANAG
jgi:hypothetical protein